MTATIFELGYRQFAFWWVALLAVGAWLWVWTGEEGEDRYRLWHDERLKWWLWHWFTGGELDTDRSMPMQGSLDAYLVQRASLAIARATIAAGIPASLYAIEHPEASATQLASWGYGGALGLAVTTYLAMLVACRSALGKWWTVPLHEAIYAYCGWEEDTKPSLYIHWDRVHELGLALTITCHGSVKMAGQAGQTNLATIDDAVKRKVGRDLERIDDPESFVGQTSELRYQKRSTIPDKVPFASVRGLIEKAPEHKILLGMDAQEKPVHLDFDSDSPHFLITAGTGGGKTSMQRNCGAQCLHKGHEVFIFDPKFLSHIWARGRANVTVVSEAAEMHALFMALAGELEKRKRETDGLTYKDPIPTWTRKVLILEELSVAIAELRAWWQSPAGGNHKGEPPSVAALRKILNQGRFLMVNVIAGANRFDANQTGGGAARDQYAWIGLAEHSHHVIDMLAKGAPVEPKTREDRKGRMQIVNGHDVTEIRVVWWEDNERKPTKAKQAELEAWIGWLDAAHPPPPEIEGLTNAGKDGRPSGRRPPAEDLGPRGAGGGPSAARPSGEPTLPATTTLFPGDDQGNRLVARSFEGLKTLRQMTDERLVEIGQRDPLAALRQAAKQPGFPDPREYRDGNEGHLYDAAEVAAYLAARPRAAGNRKVYRSQVYAIVRGGWKGIRPGGEMKIGYTTDLARRLRGMTARRGWVVKVFDVEPPAPGEELPDKAWHRRFHGSSVDPDDPTCEWFYLDETTIAWLNDPDDVDPMKGMNDV